MNKYSIYGKILGSQENFDDLLIKSDKRIDVIFRIAYNPYKFNLNQTVEVYRSKYVDENNEPRIIINQIGDILVVDIAKSAMFTISRKFIIAYPKRTTSKSYIVEDFLKTVLPLWAEINHVVILHASSIVINNHAVGFLSHSGGGKSTLAAAFLKAGYEYIADDTLAIENCDQQFLCHIGTPFIRMWPENAKVFTIKSPACPLANIDITKWKIPVGDNGLGKIANTSKYLTRIYVPIRKDVKRTNEMVEIVEVSRANALTELLRHSYVGILAESIGLSAIRFNFLTNLINNISLKKIYYPNGLNKLSFVMSAVFADLATK